MEDSGCGHSSVTDLAGVREARQLGQMGEGQIPLSSFSRSLDSDQKDQLIEVIEKLLADKTTVRTGVQGWMVEGRRLPPDRGPSFLAVTLPRLCPVPSWWPAAW